MAPRLKTHRGTRNVRPADPDPRRPTRRPTTDDLQPRPSSTRSSSSGSGEENVRASPLVGWSKASSRAWSHTRPDGSLVTPARPATAAPAVAGVAEHRMADGGKVDPDLMGAPRLQPAVQQGDVEGPVVAMFDLITRPRLSPPRPHRHPGRVGLRPLDRGVDEALVLLHRPPHQGRVAPLHGARGQLGHEVGPRHAGPGHDEEAGGALVEAVDDAGAVLAAGLGDERRARASGPAARGPGCPAGCRRRGGRPGRPACPPR